MYLYTEKVFLWMWSLKKKQKTTLPSHLKYRSVTEWGAENPHHFLAYLIQVWKWQFDVELDHW